MSETLKFEKNTETISRRLVTKILLASALLTSLFTVYTMYVDYNRKKSNLVQTINKIEETSLDTLAIAIWEFNEDLVAIQANSLLRLNEMISIDISSKNNVSFFKRKENYSEINNKFLKTRPLMVTEDITNEKKVVGEIKMEFTEDFIFQEIIDSLVSFLVFQVVKTFIISFVIIYILNEYLVKNIKRITEFFTMNHTVNLKQEPDKLKLVSSKKGRDEVDVLVSAVNYVFSSNHEFLKEHEEKMVLQSSLEAAEAVQEALLPGKNREIPGLEIVTSYKPAETTGGDWYYHFYDESHNMAYFFCGDVTGHGIPSALLTAVCCGNVLGVKSYSQQVGQNPKDMQEALCRLAISLNECVLETGKDCERLMTMLMMSLNLETGELAFLNAGHNHPYLYSKESDTVKALMNSGSRLGFSERPIYNVKTYHLKPGDRLFLFTDGLVENEGPEGSSLRDRELKRIVGTTDMSLEQIKEEIYKKAQGIWKGAKAKDDITTLFLQWNQAHKKSQSDIEEVENPMTSERTKQAS